MQTKATRRMITIEEFLLARIADAEKQLDRENMSMLAWITINQVLTNQRYIVEWHKNFPVLVETRPRYDFGSDFETTGVDSYIMRATQQIAWLTQEEYVKRFGSQPPTAPLLKEMASLYSNHPDWGEGW